MGFGSFLKKALNPLSPFKAAASAGKSLVRGDLKGALLNSTVGGATMGMGPTFGRRRGGMAMQGPSQEAQAFFGTQSPEDQASIMASFGNRPDIEGWYQNARVAGSVPQPTAVSAATPLAGAPGMRRPPGLRSMVMDARRREEIMRRIAPRGPMGPRGPMIG